MSPKTRTTHNELDLVAIPEDFPELGVEAGTRSTVDTVYTDERDGHGLYVKVSRKDGTTVGSVQIEASGDPEDDWHVTAYSSFD